MESSILESPQRQRVDEDNGRRLALVTGGARRLGRRLCIALARDGYDVALSYHGSSDAALETALHLQTFGVRAHSFEADLAQPEAVVPLVEAVESEMGPILQLVNNAGVFDVSDPRDDADAFDRTIAVNLRAPYLLCQELGRRMRGRGEGNIVNIASVGGIRPYVNHVPYSLSKAGVVMLTRIMALALAPQVNVNAIAPGTIWIEGEEDPGVPRPSEGSIPLRSYGEPEDVEDALTYFLNAPYVTGQILVIDGGAGIRYSHP